MRQRNETKNREGCGNGGAVETLENQTTVFHRSHRSLEIRQTTPDSHIPTASTTGPIFRTEERKPRAPTERARQEFQAVNATNLQLVKSHRPGSPLDWNMLFARSRRTLTLVSAGAVPSCPHRRVGESD